MAEQVNADPKAKGKIPTWVYLAGGGVVVLLLLIQKNSGGGGADTESSGLLASEVQQTLTEQRQTVEERLTESREALAEALAANREAAIQQQTESEGRTASLLTAMAEGWKEQFDKLSAALGARIEPGTTPAPAPTPAPSGGAGLFASAPTTQEVTQWAIGIGLPSEFGMAFVNRYGRLPSNIAELESWRPYVLAQNSQGQWCLPGGWPCV